MSLIVEDPRGSIWRRWDPHIHAPGTVLNDQYVGADRWSRFLTAIEESAPRIQALGVTDYASVDCYEQVVKFKGEGRMPDVGVIFPNVELRYGIGTRRGSAINVHLLVSPDDPDHVVQTRRFLNELTFEANGVNYRCNREDLIRLGRAHDDSLDDDGAALKAGTTQFKITPDVLRAAIRASSWARENILVAVVVGTGDGTAGLQDDSSMAEVRREIERMAQVIFSSHTAQREFWLGKRSEDVGSLNATWGGRRVCLHGSDAHSLETVGRPDLDRFTWVKGDATFDSLRQACIEPEAQAVVSKDPPDGPPAHRTIESIDIQDAQWCSPAHIPLNRGMVGIIGARGSGKTALADLIAAGAFSDEAGNERSFLSRAAGHLRNVRVQLNWMQGEATDRILGEPPPDDEQRVRYLSQQFVERLCSSDGGITDELLNEIHRVIYDSHSPESRAGTTNFEELLAVAAGRGRIARARSEQTLRDTGQQISEERAKQAGLADLRKRHASLVKTIAEQKAARKSMIVGDSEPLAKRLEDIIGAIEHRQLRLDRLQRQKQALIALRDAVLDLRDKRLPATHERLRREHGGAGLTAEEWEPFRLRFSGDAEGTIDAKIAAGDTSLQALVTPPRAAALTTPIPVAADLAAVSLALLKAEAERIKKQIGLDDAQRQRLQTLDARISRDEVALKNLEEQITDSEGAAARIAALQEQRSDTYAAVFDAIQDEEAQLKKLYAPLDEVLAADDDVMGKLAFTVRRVADLESWAAKGEALLDLRTAGPFKGHGALKSAARAQLMKAWESGSSAEVAAAMASFRQSHDADLMAHSPVPPTDRVRHWSWGGEISAWLTSTDHVSVSYSIQYDGVDVEQLSPGTRGIVLLLLYLSIDESDDRPLIIDQPEENLDPKSIFDELVARFTATRLRRQVIIVTHNANLIVNTDADQVIVASAGPHRPTQLPEISYQSGGLENHKMRREVCEILEGGVQAFKERARRLRVDIVR